MPNIWFQIARPVHFNEQSPAVLIVGSAVELADRTMPIASAAELDFHCRAIAEILARHGVHLVADACPGIPNLVEQAYVDQQYRGIMVDLSVLRRPDETQTSRAYSPTGFPACGDVLCFCGTGFEVLSIINTYCADLVLVVGGGLGSLMEGIIAVANDLPVVCYAPMGGMATEMQSLFERYRSRYKNLQIDTVGTLTDLEDKLAAFVSRFRQEKSISRLSKFFSKLQPAFQELACTEILVDSNLRQISYQFGETSVQLSQPQLAIDETRILEHASHGAAIRNYLDATPRRYEYDGVSIHVPAGIPELLWCPSIDTFAMLSTVRSYWNGRKCDNALDVGTGTGVIGLWLAATDRAADVLGIDKNEEAARCASINAEKMQLAHRCRFRTTKYEEFRNNTPGVQLVTCNPPYVPRIVGQQSEDGNFEGVNLVIELLSTIDSLLSTDGVCFLGLSSTSWTDATVRRLMQGLIEEERAALLFESALPFKVADVLLHPQWLKQLVDDGGIFRDLTARYTYLHKVQIWQLVRDPNLLAAHRPDAAHLPMRNATLAETRIVADN